MKTKSHILCRNEGWHLECIVDVKNIGKSPAIECANIVYKTIGYENVEDDIDVLQRFLKAQSDAKTATLFPTESEKWIATFRIGLAEISSSEEKQDGNQFLTADYCYKSTLQDDLMTIIRMYQIGIGGICTPLPKTFRESGDGSLYLKLWREYVR